MVKIVLSFLLLFSFTFADETVESDDNNLTAKIKSFLDTNVYEANNSRIDQIFLTLNNTDRNLAEDIKTLTKDNKEDHLLILNKMDDILTGMIVEGK